MRFLKLRKNDKVPVLGHKCLSCFRALSVSPRLRIFGYIKSHKEKTTVSSLVKHVSLRQPTVTFHINELVKARLITKKKEGREVFCQVRQLCDGCFITA